MKFTAALMPGVENVLGIRLPVLRKIARQIAAGDWRTYLAEAEDFYFEERMLQGLVIGCARCTPAEKLEHVARFVPKINNWAVCDCFCWRLKAAERQPMWEFIQPYFRSEAEYDVRFAVVTGAGEFRRRGAPRGTAATARRRPPRSLLRPYGRGMGGVGLLHKIPAADTRVARQLLARRLDIQQIAAKNRRIVARERHGQTGDPRHETAQTGNFTGRREPAPRHRNGRAGGKTAWTGPKTTDRR